MPRTRHAAAHEAMERDLALATVRNMRRLLPLELPGAMLLAIALAGRVPTAHLIGWVMLVVVDVVRGFFRRRHDVAWFEAGNSVRRWTRRAVPHGIWFGVTWAALPVIALGSGDGAASNVSLLVVVAIGGLLSGTSVVRFHYLGMMIGLTLPTAAAILVVGGDYRLVAVLGVAYMGLMMGMQARLAAALGDALVLKHVNVSLAEQLASEHALAQAANDQLSQLNTHLTHRASHDPLTGLANRSLALDTLATAVLGAAPDAMVAVLYADLDGFKPINDTHGHQVGDHVLVAVARRLAAVVNGDDLVGRLGGDEFVVVVRGLARRVDAEGIGERLRHAVDVPLAIDGLTLQVGLSIGVALTDRPCVAKDLLRVADDALYEVKHSGRGRVLVAPTLRPAPLQAARRS